MSGTGHTHVLKHWSKTKNVIALSSGESEIYAILRTSAEALGIMAMARDLGIQVGGKAWGDASAALGIIQRKGLGRTRHIDVGYLWVQQVAAERRLEYGKVLGRDNPADLFTKYVDQRTMDRHVETLKGRYVDGRPSCAPELHYLGLSWDQYNRGIEETKEERQDVRYHELETWAKPMADEMKKIMMKANRDRGIVDDKHLRGVLHGQCGEPQHQQQTWDKTKLTIAHNSSNTMPKRSRGQRVNKLSETEPGEHEGKVCRETFESTFMGRS